MEMSGSVSSGITVEPVPLSVLDNHGLLLQSGFWGFHKSTSNQDPKAFIIKTADLGITSALLILVRKVGFHFSIAYAPFGPVITSSSIDFPERELLSVLPAVSRILKSFLPNGTVFIRFDIPWDKDFLSSLDKKTVKLFKRSPVDIQPADTVVVDISPTEEEILSNMKSKTRYNIRLAEKKGVRVIEGTPADLATWYAIYQETSLRDRIAIHSLDYYQGLFTNSEKYPGHSPEVKLYLALSDDEVLAGNVVVFFGKTATYLYGASKSQKRNYMPAYALQWRTMQIAKEKGCSFYDLFGIPPTNDPSHPMHGLYRFKTGFGGEIVSRGGCWDYPLLPTLYSVTAFLERLRYIYYKKIKKIR